MEASDAAKQFCNARDRPQSRDPRTENYLVPSASSAKAFSSYFPRCSNMPGTLLGRLVLQVFSWPTHSLSFLSLLKCYLLNETYYDHPIYNFSPAMPLLIPILLLKINP